MSLPRARARPWTARPAWLGSLSLLALLLSACAQMPLAPATHAHPIGLTEVLQRPAERALLGGLLAYQDGDYGHAETQLQTALSAGLLSPADQTEAHKHLAFITCSTARMEACEAAFRQALAVDPAFSLTRAEAGHPVWGPVYRRLLESAQ